MQNFLNYLLSRLSYIIKIFRFKSLFFLVFHSILPFDKSSKMLVIMQYFARNKNIPSHGKKLSTGMLMKKD